MGKKKINNLQYLEENGLRKVASVSRKRGLLKKCIEISSMCGMDVYLFIREKEYGNYIEFKSST